MHLPQIDIRLSLKIRFQLFFFFFFQTVQDCDCHMPSPSSPLEYRPTPHLILIILFFVFPLIYIFARLALTACCLLAFVVKSMFSWLLQILYDYDELTPMTRPVEVRQRHQTPPTPTPSAASAVREGLVEISTSEEEVWFLS